jgi:hypothetical protein
MTPPTAKPWSLGATLLAIAGVVAVVVAGLVVAPSAAHVVVVVLAVGLAVDLRARAAGVAGEAGAAALPVASLAVAMAIASLALRTTRGHLIAGDAVEDRVWWGVAALGAPLVLGIGHEVGVALLRRVGPGKIARPAALLAVALLAMTTLAAVHRSVARPPLDRLLALPSARRLGNFEQPPVCGDERLHTPPPPRSGGRVAGPALTALLDCATRADCDPEALRRDARSDDGEGETFPFLACGSLILGPLSPDLVVLRQSWQDPVFRNVLGRFDERSDVLRRDGPRWELVDDAAPMARLSAAPSPWIATSAFGVVLGALCWIAAVRARRPGASHRWERWALSIALLSGAPLVGAALAGLVFG